MRFSVVTPSFRQLELLKLCVASVADQDGDVEVEHLVQDGGTGPEFVDWALDHAPPGWVSEPDDGMYDAINRGFRRAGGEILSWLNCDEQYLPGALAQVAAAFAADPGLDVLFGDVVVVDDKGVPESYRMAMVPWSGHVRHCTLPTFSAATFIRRRVFDGGHALDSRWKTIADAVWIDGMVRAGLKAAVQRGPLAAFKRTGENLGQSELARRELAEWRRATGSSSGFSRRLWAAAHRLRKWKAGAYRSREVEVSLHVSQGAGRTPARAAVNERWRPER